MSEQQELAKREMLLNFMMDGIEIVSEVESGAIKEEVDELLGEEIETGKTIEQIAQELNIALPPDGVIQVVYPQKFISDTSELRRKLPLVPVDGEETTIGKMGVKVILKAVDDDKIILSDNLTHLDLLVYMGICTWIDRGIGQTKHDIAPEQRFFTPMIIYNCINPNNTKKLTESSPEIMEIKRSIDKLRHIKVIFDYSGFFKGKDGIERAAAFNKEDWFVNAAKATITVNGETLSGYQLNVVPPMYWASKQEVKQLATYDRKLLSTPTIRDTSGTATIALLKHDILAHIQTLKHKNGKRMNRKIKYTTLFERNGITIKDKHERKRRREQIKKYLDFLVQEGELTGYSEYKEGREFAGIEFYF